MKSFASNFIELMAESGTSLKTCQKFYRYPLKPSANLDKLIDIAEDTIVVIEEKI